MNINNFEQETDSKILCRGKDYFNGGSVLNLEETEPLCYEAVVEGTEDYTACVSLAENGEVTECSCDCPYEFGRICKHEVAVLLAIRSDMKSLR